MYEKAPTFDQLMADYPNETVDIGIDMGNGHVFRDTPLFSVKNRMLVGEMNGLRYDCFEDNPLHVTNKMIEEMEGILGNSSGWVKVKNKFVWF